MFFLAMELPVLMRSFCLAEMRTRKEEGAPVTKAAPDAASSVSKMLPEKWGWNKRRHQTLFSAASAGSCQTRCH